MAIPATQMRPGMIIKHKDQLHLVFKVEHRTPGNLRAFIQAKLRNIRTGAMFEERFRSADAIEKVVVDEVSMEFLYADGDDYYFMNPVDYEQTVLKGSTLGDAIEYLTPNLQIKVSYHDGQAVGIDLPAAVELTVVETEPGLKSATASSVTKPAKTETGLVVQVPAFINEGEKIRVDTSEGAYLSRAMVAAMAQLVRARITDWRSGQLPLVLNADRSLGRELKTAGPCDGNRLWRSSLAALQTRPSQRRRHGQRRSELPRHA
jgi:elongation factor P